MADNMNAIDWLATVLVIVGGLNWGLVGIGEFLDQNWNAVDLLLGSVPELEWTVYILVGLAAIWEIYTVSKLSGAMEDRARARSPET